MDRWVCAACGSLWAPGAPCCPQCRSSEHAEEGDMPRITVAEGPSNAVAAPGEPGYVAPEEPVAADSPEVDAEPVAAEPEPEPEVTPDPPVTPDEDSTPLESSPEPSEAPSDPEPEPELKKAPDA